MNTGRIIFIIIAVVGIVGSLFFGVTEAQISGIVLASVGAVAGLKVLYDLIKGLIKKK